MSDSTSEMTTSHAALLMNLLPSSAIQGRSALAHAQLADGAGRSPGGAGVFSARAGAARTFDPAMLSRKFPAARSRREVIGAYHCHLNRCHRVVLTIALFAGCPPTSGTLRCLRTIVMLWNKRLWQQCRVTLRSSTVVAASRFTRCGVSGVLDLLMKSTPIDVHLSQFPIGKVVSTVFAKAGGEPSSNRHQLLRIASAT